MHAIESISAIPVDLPLRETFETSQRRVDSSPSILVKLRTSGGVTGWGEATPVSYVSGEDRQSVLDAVARAREALVGRPVESYRVCSMRLQHAIPESPGARTALEVAILDAASKAAGLPLYLFLGGRPITVETDITIPLVEPVRASALAHRAAKQGFTRFKIKVGSSDLDLDIERIAAVASTVPGASFIVDANEAFQPDEAVSFVKDLVGRGISIDIFEQPVPRDDLEGLKRVKELSSVAVFADEAAHSPEDVFRIARFEAASGIVAKTMKFGPLGVLAISSIAQAAGLDLMMGTMLESRVGQSASLHIAAAAGTFAHFDLDSDMLLAEEQSRGGFTRTGSILTVHASPGLGVEVDI